MSTFKTYTRIPGLSDRRRFPRVGKIRLGVRLRSAKGKEYPSEVPYFVVKEEVEDTKKGGKKITTSGDMAERFHQIYGEKPTQIEIVFPVDDEHVLFPQAYKKYGASGLACKGDGCTYTRIDKDTGEITEGECPAPEACDFARDDKNRVVCRHVANLTFLLPRVTLSGCWQIDTSSEHAFTDVNSGIDYIRAVNGRIDMIPLILRREERETRFEGKPATHWPLQLLLPETRGQAQKIIASFQAAREALAIPVGSVPRGLISARPDHEIEEEMYPKDLVREVKQIEGSAGNGNGNGSSRAAETAASEPQDNGGPGEQTLPGMGERPDDDISEMAGADLLLSEKERTRRAGEAVAGMAKEQREARSAAKTKAPATDPADSGDIDDFLDGFDEMGV